MDKSTKSKSTGLSASSIKRSGQQEFFDHSIKGNNTFFGPANRPKVPNIQRALPEGDPIHSPLLDQYSRATGLPRDAVAQHDPGYERWLIPINITLDMPVPSSIPNPDYSKDEDELNAWEQANFKFTPQISFNCDSVVNNGVQSSFVTDVEIRLTQARFEYFIARHIQEGRSNRTNRRARITWTQIHRRIKTHAREHFVLYRQTVDEMEEQFYEKLSSLPNRFNPVQVSQQELETYVESLLRYLIARLRYRLWQVTCNWERTDYPNILQGIPNVISGRLTPSCGPQPTVPPVPVLPTRVTPSSGSSGTNSSSQSNLGQGR